MGIYANDVQKLYIAYFNRPADPVGLAYWEEQITKNGGSTAAVANAFSASAEYKALYDGKTSAAIVDTIYQNLFGRSAEVAGLTYWAVRLENGTFNVGNIALSIMVGAQNDDKKVIDNKTLVATEFTNALDTTAEILAYSGATAAEAARTFLKTVAATDASLTAAKAAVASTITSLSNTTVANGTTYTLTTGVDNVAGTSANDTVNAMVTSVAGESTLTAADKIVGGAGTDVLNVTVGGTATAVLNASDVSGVEVINVRNIGTGAAAIDASTAPGATTVASDRSTGTLAVTNLAAGSTVGVKGNGVVALGAVTAGYSATATEAKIAVSGGTATGSGSVTVNAGAALTSATITSDSASNVVGGVAFTAGAVKNVTIDAAGTLNTGNITGLTTASTITVKGSGNVNVGTLLATNVTALDASASTGGVTAVLNGVATLSVKGGAGNDVITTGAALTTGSVDAGAGTADRLVVATSAHIDATTGKLYKGFEQVQVQDGQTVDVSQLATNNTIDTIRINNTAGTAGATGLTAAQAEKVQIVNAAAGVVTLGVTGATAGGQIDTVKAALTTTTTAGAAQAVNLTGFTLAGIEKLELTANGTAAATSGAVTLTTTNATVLDSIKLASAGVNSVTIAAGHQASNLNVDASASSGATTINATAYNTTTGATLTGGSGADSIMGSTKVDTIVGGAGNDVIFGDGSAAEVQTVTFTGASSVDGTATIGGVAVSFVAATHTTATLSAAKAAADITAAIAAGTAGNIASATSAAAVLTLTYKAGAGNVAAATATNGTADTITYAIATTTEGGATANSAADVITGGDGKDVFNLGVGAVADADWIKDLNLGTDVVAGQVDTLVFSNTGATKTLVTLTTAQQTTVTAATSLANAAAAVLGVAGADGATVQFTYGSDSYIIHNGDGNGTYDAAADVLVKITGVTGTIDLSDFSVI